MINIEALPGYFYEAGVGLFLLANTIIPANSDIYTEETVNTSLFTLSDAFIEGEEVGHVIETDSRTSNIGAVLDIVGEGELRQGEMFSRSPNLVIYTYGEKRALMISPLLSPSLQMLLEDQ